MHYLILYKDKPIGIMRYPGADDGMGVVYGDFVPTPDYEEVRHIFRLFTQSESNNDEQLESRYWKEREALELSVTTSDGLPVPQWFVHIIDYSTELGEGAYHAEFRVESNSFFEDPQLWWATASGWHRFNQGDTIRTLGSESGIIWKDDEHELGARITLEAHSPTASFAITCGIYGWMFHTRYFKNADEACEQFEAMRTALATILDQIPNTDDPDVDTKSALVTSAIDAFIKQFP